MKPSLLLVDDDPATLFGFSKYLTASGFVVSDAACLARAGEMIGTQRFDAVILDMYLPDGNGLDWIGELRSACPDAAIIVITGLGDIPLAVEAMRRGADNFLTKPVNLADMELYLKKSLELSTLRRRNSTMLRISRQDPWYFGASPAMKKAMELATVASESDAVILLQGESGSGKGIMAKWIYERSSRRKGPFIEVNCASLRGELLASELFGHVKGAFTSAVQDRQGLIEVADGGTLFLDEIGDMDPAVQSQFLKVIEEKCYRRLGETRTRRSDFRLICATNKDLAAEMKSGNFRQDLYFRINLFPLPIPPLREREEDIPGLAGHILHTLEASDLSVSEDAMSLLAGYDWPGNIRELRNVLERAVLLARRVGPLKAEHFPGIPGAAVGPCTDKMRNLAAIEADYITSVLEKKGGDVKKAAKEMGISRATLYRKLKKQKK